MEILENISLKPYTSMYVGGPARYFATASSASELVEALRFAKDRSLEVFLLGRGSNIIFSDKGFSGLVIKVEIKGKKLVEETEEHVLYEVGAGETWDDFVKFSVERGLYGIENMSHVPGSVGASVIQNIGCYGQEVSETVDRVKVLDRALLKEVLLENSDLKFSYRKSLLNDSGEEKNKYVVTSVIFRLKKHGKLNLQYGDIEKYFANNKEIIPSLSTLRTAIIGIRNSKFPFPDSPKNGTCGSFWKVDVVDEESYLRIAGVLKATGFGDKAEEMINKMNVFTIAQGLKVTAALFIDVLGYKGKTHGGAKILETHAGIINNYTGTASAEDVIGLSKEIENKVWSVFGVKLKTEPELVGDFN